MKISQRDGRPVVWYDELQRRTLRETERVIGLERSDPPGELALLAFLDRLTDEERDLVIFFAMLNHHGFRLDTRYWESAPIEALLDLGGGRQ